ncbi:MAG: alpha/beta hydrolase [Dehalococcoidia bacterium]|nr:alpha/beta hydrolase [Dehalococcoidia bacterium]
MCQPWQHFYNSQRLKLSYWSWGSDENPPLILLHGGRDHARTWDRVAAEFSAHYWVLAPDLRGHGDSEWARGSYYATVDHVLDLFNFIELIGGDSTVVGHSFGGSIALLTASIFPDKFTRIVDIEGAGARLEDSKDGSGETTPDSLAAWARSYQKIERQTPRIYKNFSETVDRMLDANKYLKPEMAEHLARWGTVQEDGGYRWKFDPWARGRTPTEMQPNEMPALWSKISCPILHLSGDRSGYSRTEFLGKGIDTYFENSISAVVPDAGHHAHHDNLDFVVDQIKAFI